MESLTPIPELENRIGWKRTLTAIPETVRFERGWSGHRRGVLGVSKLGAPFLVIEPSVHLAIALQSTSASIVNVATVDEASCVRVLSG